MSSGPVIIVLAAGLGSRFQDAGPKLSQPLGVTSVLGATLAQAQASQLPVVVVTTEALVDEAARHVARQDIVVLEAASARPAQGRGDFGRSENYIGRQIARWSKQYAGDQEAAGRIEPMERLMDWLPKHLPASESAAAIVHGDFRIDNLMFDPQQPRARRWRWLLMGASHHSFHE